jgi:hypothetical protein
MRIRFVRKSVGQDDQEIEVAIWSSVSTRATAEEPNRKRAEIDDEAVAKEGDCSRLVTEGTYRARLRVFEKSPQRDVDIVLPQQRGDPLQDIAVLRFRAHCLN